MDENPYKSPQTDGTSTPASDSSWAKAARRIGFAFAAIPWLIVITPPARLLGEAGLLLILRWVITPASILGLVFCGVGTIHRPRRLGIIGLVMLGSFWGLFCFLVLRQHVSRLWN
jgi:hypothetical protein